MSTTPVNDSAAINKHPLKVLGFSLKYNNETLIDKSSKPCLALRLSESIMVIPPHLVQKWVSFITSLGAHKALTMSDC